MKELINKKIIKLEKQKTLMLDEYRTVLDVFYESMKENKDCFEQLSIMNDYALELIINDNSIKLLNQMKEKAK